MYSKVKFLKQLGYFFLGITSAFGIITDLFVFAGQKDGEWYIINQLKWSINHNGLILTIGLIVLIIYVSTMLGKVIKGDE